MALESGKDSAAQARRRRTPLSCVAEGILSSPARAAPRRGDTGARGSRRSYWALGRAPWARGVLKTLFFFLRKSS